MTESLQWHPVSERMPDAYETVIVWYLDHYGLGYWCAAFFDKKWRFYCSGETMSPLTVTHWAQPKGPQ